MTKNGDTLIGQVDNITLLFTDWELKKRFSEDSPEIFRKVADRIEDAFKRGRDEKSDK